MEPQLKSRLKEVAEIFSTHHVQYLIVGGIAINFYGHTRPSGNLPRGVDFDIDVWYNPTLDNFTKLSNAISEISPEVENDIKRIVFDPKKTFLKFNVDNIHFDFLPELVAFYHQDFMKCFNKKEIGEIENTEVNIISKEDLIINKEAIGRDKDLADIESLKKHSYKGFSR